MKKRYSEEQIIGFLREADAGMPIKDLCRRHGFSEASYYLWRGKFGGMDVSDARRLKALEAENAKLKKLLAEAGYRVVAWDMRGHGQTASPDEPEKYSEAATVEDMAAVLDAAGAKTAVIGGMSLGGYMTLNFYRRSPERCRTLMLIDTGPGFKQDAARDKWNVYAREKGDDLL